MMEKLAFGGFDGLLVDARALNPKRWAAMKAGIEAALGHGALREHHPGRQLYYFDLTGYKRSLPKAYLEAQTKAEAEKLTVLWLKGFSTYEPVGYEWKSHWSTFASELVFVNRSDRTLTVRATMVFRTMFKGTARLTIRGGDFWSDDLTINSDGVPYSRDLVIPPGRHTVRFRCAPEVSVLPADSRKEIYTVGQFKLDERPPPDGK
jgi:hypothetical protein